MDLQQLSGLIHALRYSYSLDFQLNKQLNSNVEIEKLLNVFSDAQSEYFRQIFPSQGSFLSLTHLIQTLTATLGANDRYLELNDSGDWTLFLAAILHDRPISACIIQISEENELDLEDPRILSLSDFYLESINVLNVESNTNLKLILTDLQESETECHNAIVLLPVVKNYRLHFLNLLTIVPTLGESALILIPGSNYPWIRQANQDFLHLFPQIRLLLDLSLKNNHLGNAFEGLHIFGVGQYWTDFDQNNIDFNPHFLEIFRSHKNDRSLCLDLDQYPAYQQMLQESLQDAIRYHQQDDRDQAKSLYHQILQQDLNQDLAWANLGTIAFEEDDRNLALQLTYIACIINPEQDLYWRNLGLHYQRSRDFSQSVYCFQKSLEINDRVPRNYLNLAKALEQSNHYEAAELILKQGHDRFSDDLGLYIKQCLLKPLIYKNSQEIEYFHHRIIEHLQMVLEYLQTKTEQLSQLDSRQLNEIFEALDLAYFAYQGLDLVTIAQRITNIINVILYATQPDLRSLLPRVLDSSDSSVLKDNKKADQASSRKIRVGYVGTCLRDHVVGYLSRGWIQYHDRSQFEVFCYSINPHPSPTDSIAATFENHSDRFYRFSVDDFRILQQIVSDRLDILVFLDLNVGISITYYALLRLAPIQCSFWGNPMTSGSPQIDYFLSSQLMESWEAQNHYTEKLVYLPQLAVSLIPDPVEVIPATCRDFGLNPERITYLFTQTLLKHLPHHDYLFAEIAQRVPQSEFIFLASPDEYLAQAFLDRLEIQFTARNLKINQYCRILPVMPKSKFYALQSLVNVALDSLGWSGGVTTLDALNCHLPLVTYPGSFMRGRHSYGILQRIGVTETIAHSETEYIQIAVQLGLDRPWNDRIRAKIKQNKHKLYDPQTSINGLENFYYYLYQTRRDNSHYGKFD